MQTAACTGAAAVQAAPVDVIDTARAWLDAFGAIALATVVRTWGASPVPAGGQLLIGPDDRFEGLVSGGCVEAAVIAEAREVIATEAPRCLEFGVADETAWAVGLPCGGRIEVFIERLAGEQDRAYLDTLIGARAARVLAVVETDLSNGRRRLHRDTIAFPSETARLLGAGESLLVESGEERRFLLARVPPMHVVLVGAGHIAQVLAELAQRVGHLVTVVDPRTAFLSPERFAGVAQRAEWPETALPALGLDDRTAVVTLAHEARLDDETLLAAVRSPAVYVGALGSRRTHEKRVARLVAAGLSDADVARIDAPVGVPIGARGPAEIAVSILAAIIRARHRA